MRITTKARLLLNFDNNSHATEITNTLVEATDLQCLVAFAKRSGLRRIFPALKEALSRGMTARFAIGLNFEITEPGALRDLVRLSSKHDIKVYVCESEQTFHPKIYAFDHARGSTVIVGSANLTSGGLAQNHEASIEIRNSDRKMYRQSREYVDELIKTKVLVLATTERVNAYEKRYFARLDEQRLTETRIHVRNLLQELQRMKDDDSENGFASQREIRRQSRLAALKQIRHLGSSAPMTSEDFVLEYERLIGSFHSGGLHRGKSIISEHAADFQYLLGQALELKNAQPAGAFDQLKREMMDIPRAGVNVITEILLALNPHRFAVMNQNAVSGMRLGAIDGFPKHPSKVTISGVQYEQFCDGAEALRQRLGLEDFCELDALFNYAYWRK
jgi:HKD family nuclease